MTDLPEFAATFLTLFQKHEFRRPKSSIASLSLDDAYRVQQLVVDQRVAQGENPAGYKVGCTSAAIRQQFGLTEPICGRVMNPHVHHGDTDLPTDDYVQPAIEPEFVLMMARDMPDEIGPDDSLLSTIEWVAPGIELHNYRFWFGDPTQQELIASNGIHAGLVIGTSRVSPNAIDWEMEGVGVFRDEQLVASGIAAEIQGGPLKSLRWLINHLVRRGGMLRAGEIVIPGSAVELIRVNAGDNITARFGHVGEVHSRFH